MNNISKKRNVSTIIILAIVLLVPGFLYIALNKIGSNQYLKLPIYGEKVLSGKMNRIMGREIPDTLTSNSYNGCYTARRGCRPPCNPLF